jgi:hypothetical protein
VKSRRAASAPGLVVNRPMHVSRIQSPQSVHHAVIEIRGFQMAEKPPSTDNSTPFTKLESSEARNSATVAIFSGRPIFPRGIMDSNSCLVSLSIR